MPITDEQLKSIIEAAIMAAGEPLSIDKILTLFVEEKEPPTRDAVKEAIKLIETECETRGVELKKVSSGYRFQAKKDFTPWVSRLWEEKPARYSRALLETMVLIAYKQPLTRGEIEHVRGVAVSTHIIKTLLEREWVRVVGHRDVPGKPALYATTKAFLDYFNLKSLEELPTLSEIRDLDKINAELDLQEPGAEQAEAGEEGEGLEELAQADTGEAIAEVEAGEESASDQIVEEPSAEAQSEEVPSAEAVSEDSLSTEAAGAEVIEEVTEEFSDEEIDSNQDDRDDVMLDEHDKEMESRLALEEEEIIASIDTAENENKLDEIEDVMMAESDVSSENELVESTEPESAIEEDSKVENSVVAETVENKEQKLETAAMESDDYSEMEDVDSKFAS
jgi:segregation and condensation protein B